VFPLDGVNGVRRNLLARIGLSVGCRVSGAGGRSRSAALSLSTIIRLWQFEGLSVKHGPSDRFAPIALGPEFVFDGANKKKGD
jgi:hypothetical protein